MRNLILIIILFLFMTGCNQNNQQKVSDKQDTSEQQKDTLVNTAINKKSDTIAIEKIDTLLLSLSTDILQYLKTKNFKQLATFIHPDGLRFSPYGYVDTAHDQKLSATQLVGLSQSQKKILWGRFDGTGDPINLSVGKYFDKFVYDVNFLSAEKRSVNKTLSTGNSLKNLSSIYPGYDFTEFYFPGFNPKYEGMDWKALRLVFKKENEKYYLVAIIHDQWTI